MKCARYFLILFLVSIYACHKDNCSNEQPVNADFTISETDQGGDPMWVNYVSDTNFGGEVVFNANLDNAQYEWIIGSGTYNQQSFSLNFGSALNGSIIPITLIVHKTPDTKCYPGESGIDTLTKNMTINRTTKLYIGSWLGNYIDTMTGKSLNGDTLFVITIKNVYISALHDSVPAIYGIVPVIDTTIFYQQTYYKELTFYYDNGIIPEIEGRALVDSTNNNIEIDIQWKNPVSPYPYIREIFKGSRQ